MFGGRSSYVVISKHVLRNLRIKRLYNNTTTNTSPNNNSKINPNNNVNNNNNGNRVGDVRDLDAYRDLDKLDFMKAAKILFSNPPKTKTFGLDFHLVQLFFALMPSLAVYLVAQYARHEMKRMEAELELKKKAEEEKKEKEMEAIAAEEKEMESDPELLKVKERLEALEETIKEIVVETKKRPSDETSNKQVQIQEKEDPKSTAQQQKHHDSEKTGSHQNEKK